MEGQLYTQKALNRRKQKLKAGGWPVSKWITFCEELHKRGFQTRVYEARTTRSKYVHVIKDERVFKVRFSNHAPSLMKELEQDSDFYVGVANRTVTTTIDALRAVKLFFEGKI